MSRVNLFISISDRVIRAAGRVLGVSLFALAAHVSWSYLVALGFERIYDHRLPDLTKITSPAKDWEPFLHAFWRLHEHRASSKPAVAFVGSSMTYGYPWQEGVIFSRVFADLLPGWSTVNLSYYSADIWGISEYLLCPLESSADQKKTDVLFVEIPLVNSIPQIRPGLAPRKRQCKGVSDWRSGYFSFAFERPIGTGWVSLVWDNEAYQKPDEEIRIAKVGATYFTSAENFKNIEKEYRRDLGVFLNKISVLGRKVFVFVSPIYLPAVDEVGADRQAVERQIQVSLEVCRANTQVICLDAKRFSEDRNLFYNLTHLNQRGHRVFGEWLVQQVSPEELPKLR